jgi:hypothetical protein
MEVVSLEAALEYSMGALDTWRRSMAHQGVPLYSGGLLDSWPAKVVEEQAVLRAEWEAVKFYQQAERDADG